MKWGKGWRGGREDGDVGDGMGRGDGRRGDGEVMGRDDDTMGWGGT